MLCATFCQRLQQVNANRAFSERQQPLKFPMRQPYNLGFRSYLSYLAISRDFETQNLLPAAIKCNNTKRPSYSISINKTAQSIFSALTCEESGLRRRWESYAPALGNGFAFVPKVTRYLQAHVDYNIQRCDDAGYNTSPL